MCDPVLAFLVSAGLFAAGVWLVSLLVKPWQAAAIRFLHRLVFFWHRDHVYILPEGKPDPDLPCAVCNQRMRYQDGVKVA